MSNNKHLADLLKVASILPALLVMPAAADLPQPVDGELKDVTVANETKTAYNLKELDMDLSVSDSLFVNNGGAELNGGVMWATGGHSLTINDSTFTGNVANVGGAVGVGTAGDTLTVNKGTFKNNHATGDGGAIGAYKSLIISESWFEGNTAQYNKAEDGTWTAASTDTNNPMGGGALALGSKSESVVSSISGTVFRKNKSGTNGGAIATRLAQTASGAKNDNSGTLDIAATFDGNVAAQNGGAIYNTFYSNNNLGKGDGVTVTGIFKGNAAGLDGGAIYNDGVADTNGRGGVMTITAATFDGNFAGDEGGAIYTGNSVTNNSGKSSLTITDSTFINNHAKYFGALSAGISVEKLVIKNTLFQNNYADEVGAIGLFASSELNNVQFIDNRATYSGDNSDGGGAMFLGAVSATGVYGDDVATLAKSISGSLFKDNESAARGGAISTRSFDRGNNVNAVLDIVNTVFTDNEAGTNGGALDNYFYNSVGSNGAVYVTGSVFDDNSAQKGGAVYNHGADSAQHKTVAAQAAAIEFNGVTFQENSASVAGGAIYNETDATVILSGENVFTGNTAKGIKNDIYNDGMLKVAAGGTTTIDGGILGGGTLVIDSGATLDIGTTTVYQGAFDWAGTVAAQIANGQSYGKISAGEMLFKDGAELKLTVGSAGTYQMFDVGVDADQVTVSYNDSVLTLVDNKITNGALIFETKAIEDIASDAGLTTQAAGVVAGLANSTDRNIARISLAAQQALEAGDTELIERETSKANPDDKPVVQSVATSVQNQVLSVAAGRMSGAVASVGRAGGDAQSQDSGFWVHGLFNKSKYADQFHGYTRGIAVGTDTKITPAFTVGAGFAYNNSDIYAGDRHTDVDASSLFAYAQYKPTKWFINATAAYTVGEYTEGTTMFGTSLTSTYDVDTMGAQVMTGYDFASGVTTEMGARYLHISQDSYNNGLTWVDAMDTDLVTGVAGLKYAFDIETSGMLKLRPELRAAATYDFVNDADQAMVTMPGVAAYAVEGDSLSRMGGEFGIGFTALYRGVELSLMYDLDLHEDYTSQTGMVKFRTQF